MCIDISSLGYHGPECSENNKGMIKMSFVLWNSAIYEKAVKINLLMVVKCFKEKKKKSMMYWAMIFAEEN